MNPPREFVEKPRAAKKQTAPKRKPYDYVFSIDDIDHSDGRHARIKRILRKLVREAAIESVVHWQMDYDKTTRTGLTLGQISDAIAKRLVP